MSNSDLRQLPNTEQSNANTILQAAMAEQRRLQAERTRDAVNRLTNPRVIEDNHPHNTAEDLRIRRAADDLALSRAVNESNDGLVPIIFLRRHPDNVTSDQEANTEEAINLAGEGERSRRRARLIDRELRQDIEDARIVQEAPLDRRAGLITQQEQARIARRTPRSGGKYRRSRKLKRILKKSKRMSKKSKRYRKSKRVKR